MLYIRPFLLITFLFSSQLQADVKKLSPDKIFNMSEASVVSISNEEGAGTGIVISSSGLILTNFHVVCSALPFTVKVKVLTSGRRYKEVAFKNVKLIKIHKIYDLALLKINSKKYKFRPIQWKSGSKLKTGEVCYAIGNPGAGDKNLTNTITAGLVSCADRKYENRSYIQISAQVNPGNSGGPLLNSSGNLIGIVTFKVMNIEGVGFAIPASAIKLKDFIDPSLKKGDKKKAEELSDKAMFFFDKAQASYNNELKKLFLVYALYFSKMNIFYTPNDPVAYFNTGVLYYNLGKQDFAKAYFDKTLTIDEYYPEALKLLGVMLVNEKREDEACKLWLKGAFAQKKNTGPCAYNAGIYFLEKQRYFEAAYLARKSIIGVNDSNIDGSSLFDDASAHISSESLNFLMSKKSPEDFSLKEMNRLAADEKKKIANDIKIEERSNKEDEEDESTFDEIIGF